jgi:two-component system cell cycle sensor histidine kinase/response regulator CckA
LNKESPKTVLVVEDERVVARDLQRILERLGYRVPVTVASADDAILAATKECPDLVLMDIRIKGGIDGIETAQILKNRFDVPVVYLTAYADAETVARAKATEPFGYLIKPVNADELRGTVEVALYRHKMERRLRERERWFSTTLKSIGDAVVSTDSLGRVTFMNPVAETLTGWSTTEARGRPVTEIVRVVDHATRARLEDPISTAIESGRLVQMDGSLVAREGFERAIEESAAPIVGDGGSTVGAVIVFRDVGQQKKVQHQLELSERLASLGTMVASVAHEINNPLTLIIGNLHIALDELKKRRGELGEPKWLDDVCATVTQAEYGASQVSNIVADLKSLSRPTAGPGGAVDLQRVLRWAIDASAHEHGGRTRVQTTFGKVPSVKGDETRLGQVFVNLLVNAAQAMASTREDANEIRVTTSVDSGGLVVTEITDTGRGIPPDDIEKIFEPFFTTKRDHGGTGLGLSICRGIVASLGGSITVKSAIGFGTTFRVALPKAEDEHEVAAAEPASMGPPARVLVVDDEPMILRLAQRVLGDHHTVTLAEGARPALEALERGERFDVILCDVLMTDLSGVDFHEQVLLRFPSEAARIVFVSASAFTARSTDFLGSVPNKRLEKPFQRGELRQIVADVVREQGAFRES